MKTGRPPKPTSLKILAGNPGKRHLNKLEPNPVLLEDLTPPPSLDREGKKFWREYSEKLQRVRVLSDLDACLLEMASERWSLYQRAVKELKKSITEHTKANGRVAKPEVAIAKGALDGCRAILQEFGIGPSSRTRVARLPDRKSNDPAAKYFESGASRFLA